MLQNIKINHTRRIDAKLYNGRYYDFMLYKGECVKQSLQDINDMAIADFSTFDIASGILYSTVTWTGATNDGVDMEDIGMTGVDNGFIKFDKYKISNKDFLDIYFNSTCHIESGDTRFFMTPVTGNTQEYKYPMYLVNDNGEKYISFQGGFYQGFVKLEGFDYQVLPHNYNKEYLFHFDIRPRSDYSVASGTVNENHAENEGIFFFMGTRAENKFWPFYKISSAMTEMMKEDLPEKESGDCKTTDWLLDEEKQCPKGGRCGKNGTYFAVGDGYFSADGWYTDEIEDYFNPYPDTEVQLDEERCRDIIHPNYLYTYDFNPDNYCECPKCGKNKKDCRCPDEKDCSEYFNDSYFDDGCSGINFTKAIETEYVGKDVIIDKSGRSYTDSEGHELGKRGYYEIVTDNKFLLFDKTDEGFTTETYVEGAYAKIYGREILPDENFFLLFNKTPTGYTTETILEYEERQNATGGTGKPYNVYKDVRDNVFALKINQDGSIGYKYGVLNCDDEFEHHYEVKEEYSKPGIVKFDRWNSINVRFAVINPAIDKCDTRRRKMRLMIYVNGFLVFISKQLDTIAMKALDDVYQKQEGVPYNMSLGGGSIGLMETILPDYSAIPEYILPIERDFCGTFLGDIKSFKIYEGFINYSAIANYLS